MAAVRHIDLFYSTMDHIYTGNFLFGASYTEELKGKVFTHFGFKTMEELNEYFKVPSGGDVSFALKPEIEAGKYERYIQYFQSEHIPEGAFLDSYGVLNIPGSSFHFTRYISPLRNASKLQEIIDFTFPGLDWYQTDGLRGKVDAYHKEGKAVSCWIGHMYEQSWAIRGYEQFLMDMVDEPEFCEYILDRFCERNLKLAEEAAYSGVDLLICGDDVANQRSLMFSVSLWRKYMKTRWAKVFRAAKAINPKIKVWYHSDGNIWDIIPELIEIGVDVLDPLQPECLDVLKVKKTFGKSLVLFGTIGTQTTMPFVAPDEVKSLVKQRKREIGYDGALILAPTHILEPEVPIENIVAFYEACKETL